VKVELSRRALREMQRIDAWWREHAASPRIFLDELERAIELIETTSVLGPVYDANARRKVHRLLMEKY